MTRRGLASQRERKTRKPVRRRRPPTRLIVSEESKVAMRARLDSEEGQRCLDEFASVIAERAAKSMPSELLRALGTPEGKKILEDLWPDIVDSFFEAHSSLAPANSPRYS
jgi:hypothetical protein